MKVCAIAAEYNPFHNGHAYQIQRLRNEMPCDTVIAVMSGNFVQRGEPAVIDKWKRALYAVEHGIDVVVELPFLYAVQSASVFAAGAVELMKRADADMICFGSECGNLENLQEIADTSVNPDHLKEMLHEGMSYPKAYSLLTGSMGPNDILAVSYLKAIKDSAIQPVLIPRSSSYKETEISSFTSAYAIRRALENGLDLQDSTGMAMILQNAEPVFMRMFYPYLRTTLLVTPKKELQDIFLINEGLESHLQRNAALYDSFDDFLNACTNYRYTASRIRRSLLQIMMHITKTEASMHAQPEALRILAFNDQGRRWLKHLRSKGIKTAVRFGEIPSLQREMEYRSTLLYTSVLSEEERKRILSEEIRGARYVR